MIRAAAYAVGNVAAEDARFDAIVLCHKRRLFLLALSILRNESEAEEAVQEALLKAWRAWGRFPAPDDIAACQRWVTRVCINHCINHRRGLLRGGFFEQREPGPNLAAPPVFRAEGRRIDLDRAYLTLSPKQRAALTLIYFYGYSEAQCAELMGCGEGSVRTHIARGLKRLRRHMAGEGND